MKNRLKLFFIAIFVCSMMMSCGAGSSKTHLSMEVPTCIYYEGKIYWEVEKVKDTNKAKYMDVVKKSEDNHVLPNENFVISSTGRKLVHNRIYIKDNYLYIEDGQYFHRFAYYDNMKLNNEDIVEVEEEETDEVPVPNAIRPHFVYNGMRYLVLGEEVNENDLIAFKKVGETKAFVHLASKDFSSNLSVGDSLYASDSQNRYMIVKYASDGSYQYYENEAYFHDD